MKCKLPDVSARPDNSLSDIDIAPRNSSVQFDLHLRGKVAIGCDERTVLCVSWDPQLAETRRLLLVREGYLVKSALGRAEAIELCESVKADLLVLGQSVPRKEKGLIVKSFRRSNK